MTRPMARMWSVAAFLLWTTVPLVGCQTECEDDVAKTVAAFVPDGQTVHCTGRASFTVDNRTVSLTHVEYGARRDCPSGCFSSHVCAIEDGDSLSLFYAAWNDADEEPLGIADECPDLTTMETSPTCQPSGRAHSVVSTKAFEEFVKAEAGTGPFRFCVNRFAF